MTNSTFIKNNECFAKNGPVLANGKDVFEWDKNPEGQPKKWNTIWLLMGPNM